MIEDYLKPLALQTDLGLEATADSFYYAAQALDDNQDTKMVLVSVEVNYQFYIFIGIRLNYI
ncbi:MULTISPECIES: hypothetical protein [Acinetobacter]|jgi:hypothetical protein|uniref:Uncharacterized protein n=1 Tax=Acinetobacter johnsonii TaxID=40214 RepID=A0A239RVT4_ACIJO|nr:MULTISPECIES: hypothetical protein [Acinetobacter]ALV73825.1 hypothetical protein RZ95_13745 [Acinetobacter johnsonii XBB1]MBK5645760.1 hypothetical protein [Acinetobacter sp.]MCV2451683.1 hypothetical protein [Acinetobacter johnsonii]MDG9787928.1 hypothetical protein [Acinetobacter johnsonii]MDG9798813.1 hypothetical protein [Acinetobacter johnsonii]